MGLTRGLLKELKRAGEFSIDRVFGTLAREPFNLPFSEFEKLSPVVVKNVYFKDPEEKPERATPPAIFHRQDCLARGMNEEEIQASWQELLSRDETLRRLHTLSE